MNNKQIEAYSYYKKEYPGAIILFHVNGAYVALAEDANKVAQSLPNTIELAPDVVSFPDSDVTVLSKLADEYDEVHTILYRNANDELDFPDIKQIKKEKMEDF